MPAAARGAFARPGGAARLAAVLGRDRAGRPAAAVGRARAWSGSGELEGLEACPRPGLEAPVGPGLADGTIGGCAGPRLRRARRGCRACLRPRGDPARGASCWPRLPGGGLGGDPPGEGASGPPRSWSGLAMGPGVAPAGSGPAAVVAWPAGGRLLAEGLVQGRLTLPWAGGLDPGAVAAARGFGSWGRAWSIALRPVRPPRVRESSRARLSPDGYPPGCRAGVRGRVAWRLARSLGRGSDAVPCCARGAAGGCRAGWAQCQAGLARHFLVTRARRRRVAAERWIVDLSSEGHQADTSTRDLLRPPAARLHRHLYHRRSQAAVAAARGMAEAVHYVKLIGLNRLNRL